MTVGDPAPVTGTVEEERALLQERLARLARALFLIGLFVHIVLQILLLSRGQRVIATVLHPGNLNALVLGLLWFWLSRGVRPVRWLRVVDLGLTATVLGTALAVSMTTPVDDATRFPHAGIVPYGVVFVMFMRATYVPSSTVWTAFVHTAVAVPVAAFYALLRERWPHLAWSLPEPWFHLSFLVFLVALSTFLSHVLWGLRKRVRDAEQLGQYRLVSKLGEGGMGVVYRAEHAMLRRATAIKLLKADQATQSSQKRFEREVRLTATLTHPNTIEIYDYGRTPDGVFYYAMELLGGVDLKTLVERGGPQPPARVVHILVQACGALTEAHDAGLIHRDIKPANLVLCDRGGVKDVLKVLDFGLVKHASARDTELTGVNQIVGTPQYLAPEAITDAEAQDARADLYALGVTASSCSRASPSSAARRSSRCAAITFTPSRTRRPTASARAWARTSTR